MGLCLEDAMRHVTCAVCCEKVRHRANEQDDDETFVPGALAPPGLHLDRHTVIRFPCSMNNPG